MPFDFDTKIGQVGPLDPQIPRIKPVADNGPRPRGSVMIPVYNCLQYLPETLQSVVTQDMGEELMEIVVVDDCSTDGDVEALVADIGMGRIRYLRQPHNVGSLKNFETCLNESRGEIVHLLHGDDFVLPGYYKKFSELFERFPQAGAACCFFQYVNSQSKWLGFEPKEQEQEGLLENWLEKLASKQRLQYCAVSVKRKVYEELGGFYGVHYGEDWEMWARIATKYPFAYTPQLLASYRRHGDSISGKSTLNGQNIKDIRWVIEQIQNYLPPEKRRPLKKLAVQFYARLIMTYAFMEWARSGNRDTAMIFVKQACGLSRDPYLYWRRIWLEMKMRLNVR